MSMSNQEIAIELVKISRSHVTAKQDDDVDDLYIKYLNKLMENEEASLSKR